MGRIPRIPGVVCLRWRLWRPEIWINREATRMTAALLKNLGQLGVILSMKDGTDPIEEGNAEALKKYLRENYSAGLSEGVRAFRRVPCRHSTAATWPTPP